MTEDDLYHNKRINYSAYSCISQARYKILAICINTRTDLPLAFEL